MPQALTYPGVYVEEVPSGVRTISGVATSIALFIGWAAKGSVNEAKRIFSFADFERSYVGLDRRSYLGYSVRQFFDNGGSDAYVIRLARVGEAETDSATATATVEDIAFAAQSPGDWANAYSVAITPRSDEATRFKLEFKLGESAAEVYENLSVDETDDRFITSYLQDRSRLFKVTAVPADAPGEGSDNFAGGRDGEELTAEDDDFRTALLACFEKGAAAEKLDLFNLVCVPGLMDAATIASLAAKCKEKRAFLIVDGPDAPLPEDPRDALENMLGGAPSYAALYYPWVIASDPLSSGARTAYPPCGFVAGVYARTDTQRGVWKAPAGTEAALTGALGLADTLSDSQQGALNPIAINCLRTLPPYGNVVWGARTLDGDNARASEWKYVPVRRTALFLEESLFRGTQWVVFEPNDEPLWSQIRLNVGAFMQSMFRQGAFQGSTPREAYFVKCDRTTTTQDDINRGVVNIHVGFAPLKPAEFVVLRIQQIAGDIAT